MGGRGIRDLRECVGLDKRGCNDGIVLYVYSKKGVDVVVSIAYTFIAVTFLKDNKKYACDISLLDYCLLVC